MISITFFILSIFMFSFPKSFLNNHGHFQLKTNKQTKRNTQHSHISQSVVDLYRLIVGTDLRNIPLGKQLHLNRKGVWHEGQSTGLELRRWAQVLALYPML